MMTPLSLRYSLVVVLAAASLAACSRDTPSSSLSDTTFVAVMAELKRLHEAVGIDSATREARRAEILKNRGLTPERLDTAARALGANPTKAQAVWQAIERRAAETEADTAGAK
jgi:hypothetical protein